MLISFNWLKQYTGLPSSTTPEEIAEKLKLSTVEVEKVERQGKDLKSIVVGLVKKVVKHPDADKLKVCTVNDGAQDWQVVCGGSNVKEGMKVAFGRIGAKVRWHGEGELVVLAKAKIRGVESFGMICASTEIGLGDRFPLKEEKEILDLSEILDIGNWKLGYELAKVLGMDDVIFEIDNKSLSNRPDLWGHYGMAREVAALFKKALIAYPIKKTKKQDTRNKQIQNYKLQIDVEDKKLCPRYMAVAIDGIKIASSPDWLQKKLLAVGLRPINNIVDITNYIMLDLGQPMHAFDESKVLKSIKSVKSEITVRRAKDGEKFTTLDGIEYELKSENLVIANKEKAIALAGVIGGLESGIGNETTAIIYESANFDASSIRKTSTRLGLRTDSSARFEKSLDPNNCELAMRKAIELTLELCPGAKIASKIVDVKDFHLQQGPIELPLEFLHKKIGVEIDKKEAIKILANLGFEVKEKKGVLLVKIPTWRATKDISIAEDLIEEVARVYGYGNIPASLPKFPIVPPSKNELLALERTIKEILALEFGFSEVYNYSFVSPQLLQRLGIDSAGLIELDNPVAEDRPFLGRSLWPGLLENAEMNLHRFDEVKMFEIGKVFNSEISGLRVSGNSDELLPGQPLYLGLVFAGKGVLTPFYELSNALAGVFERLGCAAEFKPATHELGKVIHRGRQAQILVSGEGIGAITEISPSFSERLGVDSRVAVAELDLDKLLSLVNDNIQYHKISQYPSVVRDIAFMVDKKIEHARIVFELKKIDRLIVGVELFDVYEGKNLPAGKKSLAYHITYRSDDRTLESAEVDAAHAKVGEVLKKKFEAEVRCVL